MSSQRPLTGGCSCGRNTYTVTIPLSPTTERPQVFFSHSASHRRTLASPITSWLRIPLPWYRSTTHALFPDELHPQIRRSYTSPSSPSSKRHFCGFCGTPLAYWTEEPHEEQEYICLTLGSLSVEDLKDLEELGLLPDEEGEKEGVREVGRDGGREGVEWFDALVEGSRLGRTRRWGERTEGRGWRVEWEIVEWVEGEDEAREETDIEEAIGGVKRKLGEVENVEMKG